MTTAVSPPPRVQQQQQQHFAPVARAGFGAPTGSLDAKDAVQKEAGEDATREQAGLHDYDYGYASD
jgi:hypothetical protein